MDASAAVRVGEYTPPDPQQPFRLIKNVRPCEWPGCKETMPYKFGRPPRFCAPHKPLAALAAAEAKAKRHHEQRADAASRPVTVTPATITPRVIVEFLSRRGVASLAFAFTHKVFVGERMYEGETIEAAVAAAIAGEG